MPNPAFYGDVGESEASAGTPSVGTGEEVDGESEESSTGWSTGGSSTDGLSTGELTTTTTSATDGDSSSSGALACEPAQELAPTADTMVLADGFPPGFCSALGENVFADCVFLNFGVSSWLELSHKGARRGIPLLDFSTDELAEAPLESVTLALQLVTVNGGAEEPVEVGVYLVGAADRWSEGAGDGEVASVGDSSFLCREVDGQGCTEWSGDQWPDEMTTALLGSFELPPGEFAEGLDVAVTLALPEDGAPDWLGDPELGAGVALIPASDIPRDRVFVASREAEEPFAAPVLTVEYACP